MFALKGRLESYKVEVTLATHRIAKVNNSIS